MLNISRSNVFGKFFLIVYGRPLWLASTSLEALLLGQFERESTVCVALLYQGQKFSQEALNSSTIYQKEL